VIEQLKTIFSATKKHDLSYLQNTLTITNTDLE